MFGTKVRLVLWTFSIVAAYGLGSGTLFLTASIRARGYNVIVSENSKNDNYASHVNEGNNWGLMCTSRRTRMAGAATTS